MYFLNVCTMSERFKLNQDALRVASCTMAAWLLAIGPGGAAISDTVPPVAAGLAGLAWSLAEAVRSDPLRRCFKATILATTLGVPAGCALYSASEGHLLDHATGQSLKENLSGDAVSTRVFVYPLVRSLS